MTNELRTMLVTASSLFITLWTVLSIMGVCTP